MRTRLVQRIEERRLMRFQTFIFSCRLTFAAFVFVLLVSNVFAETNAKKDWLVDSTGFEARVEFDENRNEWRLSNGLLERRIVLEPNAATVSFKNLSTGEELLRAVGPEARVEIDGVSYSVGGLTGQPVLNYFKDEWIPSLAPIENSYRFQSATVGEIEKRFDWKKKPEFLSKDLPWPPKGKCLRMRYEFPVDSDSVNENGESNPSTGTAKLLPSIDVCYELYDGLPLLAKYLVVDYSQTIDDTKLAEKLPTEFRLDSFVSEELRLVEPESHVEGDVPANQLNLHVENDYLNGSAMKGATTGPGFELVEDTEFKTQVSYLLKTPCLFRARPQLGPARTIRRGEKFETFRSYELLFDGADRERRGLSLRRMYRTLAPWTAENPLMFHKTQASPDVVRAAIEQCRETGFEAIILSFGSGFNLESSDADYRKIYRELSDEAAKNGLAFGGYSLTSSRSAATPEDNVKTEKPAFGVGPCLGSVWGQNYLATLKSFMQDANFSIFENDGPYPGDACAAENHPGHRGEADSVWIQWEAQRDLYRWCRERGIYVNQPDWYFLNGGSKSGMGYRETNWSLPRAEQVIIERQNVYDGTWNKTASMGWMFVPLSQYHGGGAAATIEPLRDHLDHYDARFANLIGAGVQACYRGPRLFDSEETKAVVVKWVDFYKKHRRILDSDLIHLRRADGRDWDGWLHVDPTGDERALAFFYNPLKTEITRTIRLPLYYSGLAKAATVRFGDRNLTLSAPKIVELDESATATLEIRIPAEGYSWLLIQK